ncbi:MAG: hypothetical protein AABY22_34210 [Nanoarchaeota archaeon]
MSNQIHKHDNMKCWTCDGKGERPYRNEVGEELPFIKEQEICPTCNGNGIWVEKHYIVIDEKNQIAIDTDNGG